MKKLLIIPILLLMVSVAWSADHFYRFSYSDAGTMVMPDDGTYIIVLDGLSTEDSVDINETDHWDADRASVICTLTTSSELEYLIMIHLVEGGETITLWDKLDTRPDTLQRNASTLTGDQVADAVYNEDTATHNTAGSYGVLFKDTSVYQGAASGLTVDQIWEYDTSSISGAAAIGTFLKDTIVFQGSASGLTVAQIIDSMLKMLPADTGHAGIFGQLLFSLMQLRDTAQYLATSQGDTAIGGDERDVAIAAVSTHGAADVWTEGTRTLTAPTFPTNFADLAIAASTGKVTVGTNDDKTGYKLAVDGLDPDSSFTALQAIVNQIRDSLQYLTTSSGDTTQGGDERDIAITDLRAYVDSLIYWNTYAVGTKAVTSYANDSDWIYLHWGADTIGCITYYHVGDTVGGPPDSVKFFPVDSLR